ncbi:MAG: hypothetical protein WCW40_02405 [Bacteroidota bacterium]
MSIVLHFKNHKGKNANLVDISSKNRYTPYLLDVAGRYPDEVRVIVEDILNNVVLLRNLSNNVLMKISLTKIQLVEEP